MNRFAVAVPRLTTRVVEPPPSVQERPERRAALRLPTPLLIFVGALAVYWATRTHLNTFDAVAYANQIGLASETGKLRPLFHPHHLLFNALGFVLWRAARGLGYGGGPLLVTQTANGVLGALGLALYFRAMRRMHPRGPLPLIVTLALGGSFGYWICATDGRVNLPSVVLMIAAFGVLEEMQPSPTTRGAGLAGLLAGLAVLFHESTGLFAPVGLAGVLLAQSDGRGRRALAYGAAWAGAVVVPYVLVGVFALGLHSPGAFRHWADAYSERGWWWDFHIVHNLRLDLFALRHAVFVQPLGRAALLASPLRQMGTVGLAVMWALYAGALAGLGMAGGLIALSLPRLWRSPDDRPLTALCLLWIGLYGAFFTIWCPGAFVFWVPTLVPLGALLMMSLAHLRPLGRKTPSALALWVGVCVVLNGMAGISPGLKPVAGLSQRVAVDVRAHTPPRSLVVVAGVGDDAQCEVDIPYFANRPVLSLHGLLAHQADPAAARAAVRTSLDRAFGARREVYVLGELWDNRRTVLALSRQRPGLTPADWRATFAPYHPAPAWTGPRGVVWRLSPADAGGRIISPTRRTGGRERNTGSAGDGRDAGGSENRIAPG